MKGKGCVIIHYVFIDCGESRLLPVTQISFFFNIKRQTLFKYFVFLLYTQPDYLSKLKELLWTRVEWHPTLLCQPCASRWSACRQYHHSYPTTLSPILGMRTSRSILCFCITTTMLRPWTMLLCKTAAWSLTKTPA